MRWLVRLSSSWSYQAEHPHPELETTGLADAVATGRPVTSLPGDGGHDRALDDGLGERQLADEFNDIGDGILYPGWPVGEPFHVLGLC